MEQQLLKTSVKAEFNLWIQVFRCATFKAVWVTLITEVLKTATNHCEGDQFLGSLRRFCRIQHVDWENIKAFFRSALSEPRNWFLTYYLMAFPFQNLDPFPIHNR